MPQLAIETYFTQYFWLLVILFLFNDFILHKFIPSVAKVLKARKQTSSYESTEIEVRTVNVELPTFGVESKGWGTKFAGARQKWIDSNSK